MSEIAKKHGSPWWVGRHHTDETKALLAELARARPPRPKSGGLRPCAYCGEELYVPRYLLKPQTEAKLNRTYCSLRCKNLDYKERFTGEKNPFFGKTHTEETRELCRKGAIKQRALGPVLPTIPERIVQEELARRGLKIVPEYPLGKWCVDIFVPELNLAVFVDGCYWHACPACFPGGKIPRADAGRVPYLTKCGYKVAVLREHDIKKDVVGAVGGIFGGCFDSGR